MPLPRVNQNTDAMGSLFEPSDPLLKGQEIVADGIQKLVDLNARMLDEQEKLFDKLVMLIESKREKPEIRDVGGSVAGKEDESFKDIKDVGLSFGDIVLAAVGLYAFELDKYIRTVLLGKSIKKLSTVSASIGKFMSNFAIAFEDAFSKTGKFNSFLKGFGNTFRDVSKFMIRFTTFWTDFSKYIGPLAKPFEFIGALIRSSGARLGSLFKMFGTGLGKVSSFFKTIINGPINKIVSVVEETILPSIKKFLPLIKAIGAKLLMPLFIVFDAISGFFDGFKKQGPDDVRGTGERILDGVLGAIKKVINGILYVPLDLLKDFASWVAKQLGFEELSKVLDSFSFVELFSTAFDAVVGFFKDLFKKPKETLSNVVKTIGETFLNLVPDFIKDFGGWVKKNIFDPISDKFKDFELPSIPSLSDIEMPSFDDLKASIGEIFNNMLQGLAEALDIAIIPDSVSKFISDLGVSAAKSLGASVITRYNPDENKTETMKFDKPSGLKPSGSAIATQSADVATMKGTASRTIVAADNSSNAVQNNNIQNNRYSVSKPKARVADPATAWFAAP